MEDRSSVPGRDKIFLSTLQHPNLLWDHQASYLIGTEGFSPGAKLRKRESDRLPPCGAEIKEGGTIPPLPHMYSWRGT
jgi:hypothetical protein